MANLAIHDVIPEEVGLPRDWVAEIGKYAMKEGWEEERKIPFHSEVRSVAWSPDGKHLASALSKDQTVRVWNATTGEEIHCMRGHTNWDTNWSVSIAWSPDGKQLVTGSNDHTVRVWDVETGQQICVLHVERVVSTCWSPDGKKLASGSYAGPVRVWDAETGLLIHCMQGHTLWVTSVSWSPDGKLLASASHDRTVRVWDAKTGQGRCCIQGLVWSICWSPDGKTLASASGDIVWVWNVKTGQRIQWGVDHTDDVMSVSWSPDGKQLAYVSRDKTIRICRCVCGDLDVLGEGEEK